MVLDICRNTTYSCLDCGQAFTLATYKNHVKCLTEGKKYGGKNYVEKENKVDFVFAVSIVFCSCLYFSIENL